MAECSGTVPDVDSKYRMYFLLLRGKRCLHVAYTLLPFFACCILTQLEKREGGVPFRSTIVSMRFDFQVLSVFFSIIVIAVFLSTDGDRVGPPES